MLKCFYSGFNLWPLISYLVGLTMCWDVWKQLSVMMSSSKSWSIGEKTIGQKQKYQNISFTWDTLKLMKRMFKGSVHWNYKYIDIYSHFWFYLPKFGDSHLCDFCLHPSKIKANAHLFVILGTRKIFKEFWWHSCCSSRKSIDLVFNYEKEVNREVSHLFRGNEDIVSIPGCCCWNVWNSIF